MFRRSNLLRVLSFATVLGVLVGLADAAEKDKKARNPKNTSTAGVALPTGKCDAQALARFIDQVVDAKLAAEKVAASPLASDAEFLRRVYLDITGKIPTAEQAVAFLDSKDPQKRARLIDELLASADYGRHQADIWQALMLPRNSDNRRLTSEPLVKWLEEHFNRNVPWDRFVTELLTATGEQDKNGAVTYFLANASVDKITDSVTKLFCGLQLQCAQCHNHPFTDYKQTEYWEMAAFFMKVQTGNINKAAKNGTSPGVQETSQVKRGKNALPESAKMLPPKFLRGEQPTLGKSDPYRPVLAGWLTAAKNPYFAKAMVNRTWGQFFGRGLVHPVDDMHPGNPASHPELLDGLARQFADNGFDVKYLIRAICNSNTYQRSSRPTGNNGDAEPSLLSHMTVKVMTGEQLYDSLSQVFGVNEARAAGRNKGAAPKRGPVTARSQFVNFFNVEDNADNTELQDGIPQALRLMNAPQANNAQRVNVLTKGAKTQQEVYEKLYLHTLSRRPTAEETAKLDAFVKKVGDPAKANSDILWALVNSSEFRLNR
jgi:hypothetical protein